MRGPVKPPGVTAGSSAANELTVKGGLNAATFARELIALNKNKTDLSKTIFVVDEASMLSNPQGHKIIQLIDDAGSQCKIIGDKAQLPSPSSGRLFGVMQDFGIQTVEMTDNLRQEEGLLKEAAIHAGRGEIYDAVEKLTQVKECATYSERINEMAKTWLSLSVSERDKTLCFAPTHKNRKDITEVIRHALVDEGGLKGRVLMQNTLTNRPITSIESRKSQYYTKDEVLRFNISLPRYGITSGDYLGVQDITHKHKKNNTLSLTRDNGRTITIPLSALPKFQEDCKDLERPIEIYRKAKIELQVGDKIQWKRNHQAFGICNSDLAIIKEITDSDVSVLHEDNRVVTLNRHDPTLKHIDHGYVLTTYGAQGKDKKRGIGLMESVNRFSSTIQNFYVEMTRAIEEMIVVTDNKNNLV